MPLEIKHMTDLILKIKDVTNLEHISTKFTH